MPNFSSVFKAETTRLARREIKAAVDPLRKTVGVQRRDIAELKRCLVLLQRELRASSKPARAGKGGSSQAGRTRFTAKGLKALRTRLAISAADFGRLVGASGQSIYNWEAGKSVPRTSQQASLAACRGLGKREAARRLEDSA